MEYLQVPPLVRDTLGNEASEELVMMFDDAHKNAADSFERRLDLRLAEINSTIDHRLNTEIGAFRLEMTKAIGDLRFDLLKWTFLFWTAQFTLLLGLLLRGG
jgi:hypothetical protein